MCGGFFCLRGRGLATLLLFLYVTEEAGRKYVRDMPWPPAAERNMITKKKPKKLLLINFVCQCVLDKGGEGLPG